MQHDLRRWLSQVITALLVLACVGPAAADDAESIKRVAILGCHKQNRPSPALEKYVEAKPDLCLWVGDNVYADTRDDPSYIQKCYDTLAAKPAFQKLREQSTFMAVWDDHDYGLNNEGKNYPLKKQSKAMFRKFWQHEQRIPEDRDGVYHADILGKGDNTLQVIMLDARYNRDNPGDDGDMLGEPQWQWLEAQLNKPAKVRLIVSGAQFLLDRDSKFETWAKFPKSQKRLFELIQSTQAKGVVLIAGDQHYGEVSRVRNAYGYDAIELMFCGINQYEPHVLNRSRVSPVAHAKDAYALIDIHWEETKGNDADVPHLLFRCFDAKTDGVELTYRINFDELR